jgi:hypothetical protein
MELRLDLGMISYQDLRQIHNTLEVNRTISDGKGKAVWNDCSTIDSTPLCRQKNKEVSAPCLNMGTDASLFVLFLVVHSRLFRFILNRVDLTSCYRSTLSTRKLVVPTQFADIVGQNNKPVDSLDTACD